MLPDEATPIFVIGKHRSGTTGVANHLCEHTNLAGVQHEAHGGIHESGYYPYVVGRYGSLDSWSNFRAFVEVMSASDYFRLTGVEKEYMLSLYPTSYAGFFDAVMGEFARRRGVQYWVEKTPAHTKYALHLARTYPTARFVAIIRNVEDVVASSLVQFFPGYADRRRKRQLWTLARLVLGWVYYAQSIFRLNDQFPSRTAIIRYEHFRSAPADALRAVCASLDIDHEDRMATVPYVRNTSYAEGTSRRPLRPGDETLISLLSRTLQKVPHGALRSLDSLARTLRPTPDLPEWFFKLSDRDLNLNSTDSS